jgi:molybdopterin converting factor small subunit
MSTVRLEVMPWLSRYLVGQGTGRVILERVVGHETTIRQLLEEVTSENHELGPVLFDATTGQLGGHICLILNGRLMELAGGMETRLRPDDTVLLMPGISGG